MLAAVAETCGAGPGQISVGGRRRFSKSACSGPSSALHPPISTGWPGGPRTCRPHDALPKALPILRRHSINSKPSLLKCPPPPFSLGSSFFVVFPWPPAAPSFPSTPSLFSSSRRQSCASSHQARGPFRYSWSQIPPSPAGILSAAAPNTIPSSSHPGAVKHLKDFCRPRPASLVHHSRSLTVIAGQ